MVISTAVAWGTAGMRVARAAVFAALCVTLSAGGHVLLSARPLPRSAVFAVAVGVFLLALALAGDRERRYWQIAALLVPLHLAADTVFTSGQAACYGPGGGPVTGPLRVMGWDLVCAGGDFGTPLAHLAASGSHPLPGSHPGAPWLLLAGHLVVGLTAAAWLRGGEAALVQLVRAAAAATFRPLLVAVAVLRREARAGLRPAVRMPGRDAFAPALPLLCHSVLRRGPPPGLAPA